MSESRSAAIATESASHHAANPSPPWQQHTTVVTEDAQTTSQLACGLINIQEAYLCNLAPTGRGAASFRVTSPRSIQTRLGFW